MERLKPHDLLRVRSIEAARCACCQGLGAELPEWARTSLWQVPWVVVRRAHAPAANSIPVGVRGKTRGDRLAAFVDWAAVAERLAPENLLSFSRDKSLDRTPALRAVGELEELLRGYSWGPTGSVGFELASGTTVTSSESDVDLLLRAPNPLPLTAAIELSDSFATLSARVDAQLDTPSGGVSLREYIQGGEVLVRSPDGPRIVRSPWQIESAGMRAERGAT